MIGIVPADGSGAAPQPADGHACIAAGDRLIVIAEDDDTIQHRGAEQAPVDERGRDRRAARPRRPRPSAR